MNYARPRRYAPRPGVRPMYHKRTFIPLRFALIYLIMIDLWLGIEYVVELASNLTNHRHVQLYAHFAIFRHYSKACAVCLFLRGLLGDGSFWGRFLFRPGAFKREPYLSGKFL
jgi:hypothetical protein